jgi:hypothetical protein
MKRDHDAIKAELEEIKREGLIRPSDVVEHARNPDSALHACFEWDDSEAAHQFRLDQARKLLRVYVVTEQANTDNVRAFVSLSTDRRQEGGGYRTFAEVMDDDQLREQLFEDALNQLRSVQQRYQNVQRLAKVWQALDEAEREAPRRPPMQLVASL